jgi:hypothetical protein
MAGKQQTKSKTDSDSAKKKSSASQAASEHEGTEHERADEAQELDDLLELLEQEDYESIDMEAATAMIDYWQDILGQSDDAGMKDVAKTLGQLKKSMTSKKLKEDEVAELLTQMGDQVDEVANSAKRGYKTKLHHLGKALRRMGEDSMVEEDEEMVDEEDMDEEE